MKEKTLIILVIICLLFTACSNADNIKDDIKVSQNTIPDNDNQSKLSDLEQPISKISFNDLKKEEYVNYISIDNYIVSTLYNTNANSEINKTISIYGKVQTSDDPQSLHDALSNRFSKITLKSGNDIVLESDEYYVNICKVYGENAFELVLNVNDLFFYNEDENIAITSVLFKQLDDYSFSLDTNNFFLGIYNELENHVKIIESPTSYIEMIEKDKNFTTSYTFLTVNENYNKNYDVYIEIPKDLKKDVEIISLDFKEDDKMKKEVEKILNFEMTLQQKQNLKVITINVIYKKLSDKIIFLKPNIKLNIAGDNQIIAPYVPLVF
ncbi:MAG: hypothetical protein H6Q59_2371 [Firmicutes bacterium]|nr:hypothetical protein [Bacillota bacterium]